MQLSTYYVQGRLGIIYFTPSMRIVNENIIIILKKKSKKEQAKLLFQISKLYSFPQQHIPLKHSLDFTFIL